MESILHAHTFSPSPFPCNYGAFPLSGLSLLAKMSSGGSTAGPSGSTAGAGGSTTGPAVVPPLVSGSTAPGL